VTSPWPLGLIAWISDGPSPCEGSCPMATKTRPSAKTGELMIELREGAGARKHAASLGLPSNRQSSRPDAAS